MPKRTSDAGPRRRAEMQEQTRETILEAAEQLFATKGIAQTSLDQVAEAAGYTKGAIYSNFESKEQLLVQLVNRRRAATRGAVTAVEKHLLDGDAAAATAELTACDDDATRLVRLLGVEALLTARRDPDSPVGTAANGWFAATTDQVVASLQDVGAGPEDDVRRYVVAATALELGLELLRDALPDVDVSNALAEASTVLAEGLT